jgi:protein-disulfide isomerase
MRKPIPSILVVALSVSTLAGTEGARQAGAPQKVEDLLTAYLERFLPFDPETIVTVERATDSLPGFQGYRVLRTGRYPKLKQDRLVYVSRDGRWFFAGDPVKNPAGRPVRNQADLAPLEAKYRDLLRTTCRALFLPDADAAGMKAVAISIETGYGPVRLPGYVSADGTTFFQGALWDLRMDPRAERRRRIDLSANRASGPLDSTINVVEYADMQCSYCKFRSLQMDRLLDANAGIVNIRRHYKFFPVWTLHPWAMKAASAGDCLFRAAGPALFHFKQQVYSRQETLTVSGIDELAMTAAEAEGLTSSNFRSCYLQEDSLARVRSDMEEGYRLGVHSTPTYFIDGTQIDWVEDKVMEDFLRTLFPRLKSISYPSQ